ncbi:MAG: T9SS type A sorting domain-containing protein [Bacteroidales bacterium]|nr:T9SS type A sorting domain-containing protein [Bacteroidales bacterium]
MKTNIYLSLLLGFFVCTTFAQYPKAVLEPNASAKKDVTIHPKKSTIQSTLRSGEILAGQLPADWHTRLISFDKKHTLPPAVMAEKQRRTQEKLSRIHQDFPDENLLKEVTDQPTIGASFEGNYFDQTTPPDNSMAISNGGYIVSVTNSHVEYFNTSGSRLFTSSFDDFFGDPSFTALLYDPSVIYDSQADRFFMVVLHGSNSAISKVIVCFSKSNNPQDGWWYYKLTGDPLGANNWFDYPKIGFSTNEVYVTGNLFTNNDQFSQSVIYQITKSGGYAGNNLNWQYWYNISETPFTIVPASFGQQGAYGPGIYLVSNFASTGTSDKIRLFDLTNDISGNPQLDVYNIDANFSLAGDAPQLGTNIILDNGDNRIISAFYLNGILHFVFHSEYANNYNGLNYNRLTVSNLSNWNSKFGLDGYDYSYPSVASFGTSENDKSVMICFLRVSETIFPQVRVVYVNNAGEWSSSTLVKEGSTYVDVYASDGVARWGDYSGISRKHNASPPNVWLSGGFGAFRLNEHAFDTWIAQITGVAIGIEEQAIAPPVRIYPNPVYDLMNVEFTLDGRSPIEISVIDQQGKMVKMLLQDTAPGGRNCFSFNKGALARGIYFLKVSSSNNTIRYEKFIVQ